MPKDIVKIHNDLNDLIYKDFTSSDYALFMAICSRVKDQETKAIRFTYQELREIAGVDKNYTTEEFEARLAVMNKKLLHMDMTLINKRKIIGFTFFNSYMIDGDSQTVLIGMSEAGAWVLNRLAGNFTSFELQQFVSLGSKYAMTLFRLLKQYRTTGVSQMETAKFREIMGVPEKYDNKIVMRDVINPSIEALKEFFPGLKCEQVKGPGRGRPTIAYKFKFKKDKTAQIGDMTVVSPNGEEYQIEQTFVPEHKSRSNKPAVKRNVVPAFNDFKQNVYDFDELEKKLLG